MKEVHVCPGCGRVRRFGEWVKAPVDLSYQINSLEVRAREVQCDNCPGKTATVRRLSSKEAESLVRETLAKGGHAAE